MWKHYEDEKGTPCYGEYGEVCICGATCQQCSGLNPVPVAPSFAWSRDEIVGSLDREEARREVLGLQFL